MGYKFLGKFYFFNVFVEMFIYEKWNKNIFRNSFLFINNCFFLF